MTDHPISTRVAVVTGAARGIGAAVAARLSRDGLTVAALDLHESTCDQVVQAIGAAGGRAIAVGADVSDEAAVHRAVERITVDVGAPTVLVNNAGIVRDNVLAKITVDDWDALMAVHLRGALLMSRACASHMRQAGFGRIVTMSSTSALGNRGQATYAAAKAGLQGLTKTMAIELGPHGITANAVAPGFIETDMTRATAQRLGVEWEEFVAAAAAKIPAGRAGTPQDVAAAVSFFCSPDSGFVNGQVLYVAGGPRT